MNKAIGLLPIPLTNHLHPNHPRTKRQADVRSTNTSTTTPKPRITLPEELAQVLSTDYLHYLSVRALADLDTLMPVTAMRAATKVEIFADGANFFSARGEDLPRHTVWLNPLLDSTFWRQMANLADAINEHQAPSLRQNDGTVYQFGNSMLSNVISYLDHSFAHVNNGIRTMRDIASALMNNKLHPRIFDIIEFLKVVKDLTPEKAGLKAEDLFGMIMALPTSYYYDDRKDKLI
jgi:hypothetical protein